jgi:hypothetical protein
MKIWRVKDGIRFTLQQQTAYYCRVVLVSPGSKSGFCQRRPQVETPGVYTGVILSVTLLLYFLNPVSQRMKKTKIKP